MKYFDFAFGSRIGLLATLLLFLSSNYAFSQCSLSCNGTTQVSLSSTCDATITPNMILSDNGTSCPGGDFEVVVSNDYGPIPGGDVVTRDYMGLTLTASVNDKISGNTCWGYIIIEDKLGPMITDCPMAPPALVVECLDMNAYPGPTFTDNCSGELTPVLVSENIKTCADGLPSTDIIKIVERTYTAKDNKGNQASNTCTIKLHLLRFRFGLVQFPDSLLVSKNTALSCKEAYDYDSNSNGQIDAGEILPEDAGVPIYVSYLNFPPADTTELYPYPDVYCNTVVTFDDTVLPKIGCTQKIMRRWRINEWHCSGENEWFYTQVIEITDAIGPELEVDDEGRCIINGQSHIELTTNTLIAAPGGTYGDFNCGATVNIPLPEAADNCYGHPTFDVTHNTGHIDNYDGTDIVLPMGTNILLFTVYDNCYNSSTCHLAVDIIDNTPPIAICDQNTTVSLTTGGEAVVRAESFDDGSYDDCKLHCTLVRRMDVGPCPCIKPEFCDFDFVGEYEDKYYYLSDYTTSATIAKARAAAYGASVVKFENEEEEEWVNGAVRNRFSGMYWIGMKRFGNSFLWDDHSILSYYNFSGDTIPHVGGDCVRMSGANKWLATECGADKDGPANYRYVIEIQKGCGFSKGVKYCCEDAQNNDHMVVLRAIDVYGNYNDCMVNLQVQDKSAPRLTCPPDREVDCDYIYDHNNLDLAFGSLDIGASCGSNIFPTVTEEVNECGIGRLIRLWEAKATLEPNSQVLAHCKQIITFKNDDPFDGSHIICPVRDTVVIGCLDPADFGIDVMGKPEYLGDQCDFLGADHDDQVFNFNNNSGEACFKILREWEIIDWCQIDPRTNTYYTWHCTQVIKIANPNKPVITGCKPVNVCTYDSDCANGDVELEIWGEDDCTAPENLSWRYSIYAGEIGLGPTDFSNPVVTQTGKGDHIVASGKYPVGTHVIRWTYFDGCGNATTCDQEFTVSNCKAATAYCINGLAVDLMPVDSDGDGITDSGMIELWASDFDAGSYHPCGYPVHLSFSPDVNETNKLFDCSNVGDNIVEIYATVETPDGQVIQTYCSTFINIQDNMNSCQGLRPQHRIEGNIVTEDVLFIDEVEVSLLGSPMMDMTSDYGDYAFNNLQEGSDYTVSPYSNKDVLNGISTLDLISIQRHILGLELLDSPYKLIAADIDRNNEINGIDLVELRKLILGIYSDFPNNTSWRFVDKGYTFINESDPLSESFTETYVINDLDTDMGIDFIGVKVGDVNNSVELLTNAVTGRNLTQSGTISFENKQVTVGEVVSIPFTMTAGQALNGFQLKFGYDSEQLIILELRRKDGSLASENYRVTDNTVTISWNSETGSSELFELLVIAKSDSNLENAFELSSDEFSSELYEAGGNILDPFVIADSRLSGENVFILEQNNPNPFNLSTDIQFYLPVASEVVTSIHDVKGQLISTSTVDYSEGVHTYRLNRSDLSSTGVYYMTMKTRNESQTIKMILVD